LKEGTDSHLRGKDTGLLTGKLYHGNTHMGSPNKGKCNIWASSLIQELTNQAFTQVLDLVSDDCQGCWRNSARVHQSGNSPERQNKHFYPVLRGEWHSKQDTETSFPHINYCTECTQHTGRHRLHSEIVLGVAYSLQFYICLSERRHTPTPRRKQHIWSQMSLFGVLWIGMPR